MMPGGLLSFPVDDMTTMTTNPQAKLAKEFVVTTLIGSLAMFAAWCAVDVVVVRILPYPGDTGDVDKWLVFGLPLLHFGFAMFRSGGSWSDAISSTVAGCVLALTLIVFLGVQFHFAIGGGL
jgi:hypothetical protein